MAVTQTSGMKMVKIRDVTLRNNSAVEVLETDVDELNDFTMCGRFWNPYLATSLDIWQNMVYIKANDMWLLAKVAILDCDNRYDGCNDYYRKVLGEYQFENLYLIFVTFNYIIIINHNGLYRKSVPVW